eukprot:CAMPEP_0119304130 /NCGR_PEP_ID=MMETSP1333-20130426/5428_1 /TAXON_ID=418940 /ORGANISM="Scyphosphaera apsteinii, Strain RCC1455" /LENGTH=293 /DNA_ID=CAMNT_0007306957 /DNA_START=379 /DNA_END=1260 /DNA_ORIENTATION=-
MGISVMHYACGNEVPAWHLVYMAMVGDQIDVRMAHSIGARHSTSGSRCQGRLLLPFAGHYPVFAREVRPSPLGSILNRQLSHGGIAAMFRHPAQRLISAFLDNWHAWGISKHANRAQMKKIAPTVDLWARHDGVASCMTKMLAGLDCGGKLDSDADSKRALLKRALHTLRSPAFAFVGLVEEWDASICLFHRMMGGGSRPIAAEFRSLGHSSNSQSMTKAQKESRHGRSHPLGKCRLTNSAGVCFDRMARRGQYNISVLGDFVDTLDEKIYHEAVLIFRRSSIKYGVELRSLK